MKKIMILMITLCLCACSPVVVPVWKDKAYTHLEDYKSNFLNGKEDIVEPHFLKARKEIADGNDLHLLAVAYLTKYALHTASLESFDASEFAKLYRLEPDVFNMAYCHFLKGNFSAVDIKLLPSCYTGVLKAAAASDLAMAAREISVIDDPLSRLVACGVWVRYLPSDETILQIAISAASANGWRRPLWAYLTKLRDFYIGRGDQLKAGSVEERLELLKRQ